MKLTTNYKGKLAYTSKYGLEAIHVDHTSGLIEDIIEDSYNAYIVVEECSNFGCTHLILESDEDAALNSVHEYLIEETELEYQEDIHLIGIFKLEKN